MTTDTQPLAPTDAELTAIYKAANGEDTGKAQPLTTQRIFRAMRAAIAKWSTPAGAGEVVAHRVMRKSLSGEWASDARDWSDGPPSRALVDSICADQGRWRIDVAYAAPQPVVAREPLTDEHIRAMAREHPAEDLCGWSYRLGVADTERHHGIKGGQHGAE